MSGISAKFLCAAALWAISSGALIAAPVNWTTRPGGTSQGSLTSPANDAEALDRLTAPLTDEQMGLSSGVNFTTSFDEDLQGLRERMTGSEDDADPDASDAASDPQGIRPLTPRTNPGLRFVPTLDSVPEF